MVVEDGPAPRAQREGEGRGFGAVLQPALLAALALEVATLLPPVLLGLDRGEAALAAARGVLEVATPVQAVLPSAARSDPL
jgi:hypothetical protein